MKYREKQSEWFGKRGINWHISSVVARNTTGSLEVTSYAHLFDARTQDWFAGPFNNRESVAHGQSCASVLPLLKRTCAQMKPAATTITSLLLL